jgi:hypothetical protein
VGCGTGHWLSLLKKRNNKEYKEGLERIYNAIKQSEDKSETIIFHSIIPIKAMIAKKK